MNQKIILACGLLQSPAQLNFHSTCHDPSQNPPHHKLSDKYKLSSKRLFYTICTSILTSRSSEVRIRYTTVFPRLSFSVKRGAELNTLLDHKTSKLIIVWVITLYSAEKRMDISKLHSSLATMRYITSALIQTSSPTACIYVVHVAWFSQQTVIISLTVLTHRSLLMKAPYVFTVRYKLGS